MNSRTVFESFMTNSGLIPEELSNSGAILAESRHSCRFLCHSSGFQCYSGGITGFQMESVGHCKVLSATPEFTLRTHIWASLHTQTLYMTVSSMMNYSKAIKLLYCVKNPKVIQQFGSNTDKLEGELEQMARHKFKFVVSMQWFSKFNKEEHENAECLLHAYPVRGATWVWLKKTQTQNTHTSGARLNDWAMWSTQISISRY